MTCSLRMLVRLLDRELSLNQKLEVFDHLDRCETCRDAIYRLSRDRDRAFFIYRPLSIKDSSAA